MKYIDHKPKLAARKLRQKAEQEERDRQNAEDSAIMGELLAEEASKRAEVERQRRADKEAAKEARRVALVAAQEATAARARARTELVASIPWLKHYPNGELDIELTRRRQFPPTSVEAGIGYWETTTVDELLAELAETPLDEESVKWLANKDEPRVINTRDQYGREREMTFRPLGRPCSWAVRAWREFEVALALRQHEKDPNAIFRRVIHTMSWVEYYAQEGRHGNDPAARH